MPLRLSNRASLHAASRRRAASPKPRALRATLASPNLKQG